MLFGVRNGPAIYRFNASTPKPFFLDIPSPPLFIPLPPHEYNLTQALIEALGDLHYTPAAEAIRKLRSTYYDPEATRAAAQLAHETSHP